MAAPLWRLRKGMDRRFKAGHPWIYSNELQESPSGLDPGALVEVRDASGQFLARGYGNPKSLIAFRSLSRDPEVVDPLSIESVVEVLGRARRLREHLGFRGLSHRLCFGEADGLPGLIIDQYQTLQGIILVVQAHTAGANSWVPKILEILERHILEVTPTEFQTTKSQTKGVPKSIHRTEGSPTFQARVDFEKGSPKAKFSKNIWKQTAVILRNDLAVRKLEGLEEEKPRVLKDVPGMDLSPAKILIRPVLGGDPLILSADLLNGQKTGFFLDQFANIELAALRYTGHGRGPIRILDLCCYVGQWGSQLGRVLKNQGFRVDVLAVDASSQALEFAKENIALQGVSCEILKADVLKDLQQLKEQSFDLVISDPPAFIQSRKNIPTGTHAYLQLATQAFRLVKPEGMVVCCSCSGLLEEDVFLQVLAKASRRNSKVLGASSIRWVGRGTQSPDHPVLVEFPEGRYLKGLIGINLG